MRVTSLLPFALVLACSPADKRSAPDQAQVETTPSSAEPAAKPEHLPFDQRRPLVGDPAPPIELATLSGSRVSLPGSNADRAAVLIFGSFS